MTTLVHAALMVRRTARAGFGVTLAATFALLPALGAFVGTISAEHAVVGVAWLLVLAWRGAARWKRAGVDGAARDLWVMDLELGVLLLAGAHAGVQAGGGLGGALHPILYVAVAFLAAFAARPAGALLVLLAIGIEALVWIFAEPDVQPREIALHALFILFFGVLNALFTRAEIARVRQKSRIERDAEKVRAQEDLRLFRLVGAPSVEGAEGVEQGERVHRSSVEEVRDSLYHVLELLHRTLELHTCVLLYRDADERLRIVELVTDSEDVAEGPFEAGAGAVGAVASRGLTMNLEHLKPGYKGLCYYREPAIVRAFCAVPVEESGHLRGALCADRVIDRPFTPHEEETLKSAIGQVLRAIQNERVFLQLERSKREQAILFKASAALGEALTEAQVMDAGFAAAGGIARFDFAALTRWEPDTRKHSVLRAVGDGAASVEGLVFRDNASLTAMVVKNRHYLPYRGELDARQTLYTARTKLPELKSALVLPLVVREDAIGTLAVAAQRPEAFSDSARRTLQVLANQLAIALSNARAVRRLEEMATTDGLTGCLNKRAFLEDLESKFKSAERFGKKLSLLVTDIDHFKSVNDTYGHATGDVVIKALGDLLMRAKRETDRVARFGGEEFCVLCEETDTEGALQLAERIREELESTVFETELGKLRVKCSIGVATYPKDAKSPGGLFDITDKALYAAKRGGRNRVCTSEDI